MSPEEIIQAYNVVVEDIKNKNAQEAARVGNAQRSLGPLAERVASPSGQTSGLANYTYNRVMRPVIETNAAALTTAGYSGAMDKNLGDALRAAKNRYEDAKNNYTVASTTPSNGGGGTSDQWTTEKGDSRTVRKGPVTPAGVVVSVGSSGNGAYDIIVADGKGGHTTHQFLANSREEAMQKYYNKYGGGPYGSTNLTGGNNSGLSGGGGGGGGATGR